MLESLGDCKLHDGDFELAAYWYQAAIEQGNRSAEIHRKLGMSQSRLNEFDEAEVNLSESVRLAPGSMEGRRQRLQSAIKESLFRQRAIDDAAFLDAIAIRHQATSNDRELYDAAVAFALASTPEKYEADARACLEAACQKGLPTEKIRGAAFFRPYAGKSWFEALLREAAAAE
jgi:hypothetical protein